MNGGVFLLEDDESLRELLSDAISRLTGRRCLSLATLSDLRRDRDQVLACSLGILDVNLGPNQPSGLDAFAWLRAERFAGRLAFLTGHAVTHPLVQRAAQMGRAQVLRKPLDAATLATLL
jgi:ActR/RegA family two-component response regulator